MDLARIAYSLAVAGLLLTSGCLEFDGPTGLEGRCWDWASEGYVYCDAGVDAATDAEPLDSGVVDAARDAGMLDVGFPDTGPHPDAQPVDVGFPDSGLIADAEPVEAGPVDSGERPDAEPLDAGFLDSGEHPDAQPVDVGFPDAGFVDVGFPDSGVHPDAEVPDAGFPDSGVHPDAEIPMVTITIQISGFGHGSVTSFPGLAIDCHYDGAQTSGVCSASFAVSDTVTLEASADRFYSFNGWTNACASSGNRFCQLDFSFGNQTITAFFN